MEGQTYRFIVETTATGYSAYEETEPVFTTGATLDELLANVREALAFYLEDGLPEFENKSSLELVGLRST